MVLIHMIVALVCAQFVASFFAPEEELHSYHVYH